MSSDVVKYAFIAGELSPTLYGRSDLTKFDLGMAEAHNFFVDYRGGLSSRPGFQHCELVKEDALETRMTRFAFSPDIENTYVVLFGNEYIRFLQDGSYVLEDPLTITGITQANPAVVTSAGHGLVDGQWVKLAAVAGMTQVNGRTFKVDVLTANTFSLLDPLTDANINSTGYPAYTSGGTASAIYEIASPYTAAQLSGLVFDQYRDYIRITSRDDLPQHDLVRTGHADWSISETVISPYVAGPTITGHSSSTPDASILEEAQTIFAVSAVYSDGSESSPGAPYKVSNVVNYPVTEGSVSIEWTADAAAVRYKLYRSVVSVQESLSYGSELGYAGNTRGTKFTDPNIIPDYTQTPQQNYNPFAPGAITSIEITAAGAGYTTATVITLTGGGTGFDAYIIPDDTGGIVNTVLLSGGTGYVAPTASFSIGAGATATVTARPMTGTYPALSAIFQQRQIYAASQNQPVTIWGSQYKRFGNFSSSEYVLDSDSFEFDLDTASIAPIKHLVVTRGGLLTMTQENIWLLNGGGVNEPLTPTNALADPQSYTGVSDVRPIMIDSEILYVEGKGYAVRLLSYNEISKNYGGEDKSILSNHLFGRGKRITEWAYQESPFKTVWSVREDGALLAFTIVKAEEVFAWTPCSTRGKFTDCLVAREINDDRLYVTTQRFINGRWTKFVERQDLRTFVNVEDAWCVDAGLSLTGTSPAAEIMIYHIDDVWTAVASASVFTGSADKILRAGNGIFRVTTVTSGTEVVLEMRSEPNNWVPETGDTYTFPIVEGDWTLDIPVTTLSGLWHLEGESVAVLGDGNVIPNLVVTNGTITLPQAVTRCIVGLSFTCRAKTLPMIVPDAGIESKRKRIVGLAVRLTQSRGLQIGDDYERVYPMPERTDEAWGQPTRLQEGIHYRPLGTSWTENGHTYFKLEDPLPVTLLSLVSDIEVGDEPD